MSERLEQLRAMLADEPGDRFLRYAIALELKRQGHLVEAISDLEALLRDAPDHVPSYHQLAVLLAESGKTQEAIEACKAGALQCIISGDRKARAELTSLQETLEEGID